MLQLEHVKKSYDGVTILEDISLDIEDGEIVSILGPSGCGKTTLLNLILGITESNGGKIIFDGEDITDVPMEKRGFNIVFQDYALFPNLNVYKNITYGLRNKPDISTKEEVDELIRLLELEPHLEKKIDQLSGGQKQRVALARTMVMKPKILLLDEPLSALDGVIKESIKDRIKTIAKEYHLTTIIVTHSVGKKEGNACSQHRAAGSHQETVSQRFHKALASEDFPIARKAYGSVLIKRFYEKLHHRGCQKNRKHDAQQNKNQF